MSQVATTAKIGIKDFKAADPRWCTGCGDYGIVVALRRFMADKQLDPASVVNVSGIGCSGRIPHYINTYGFHGVHGRAIPIAMGVALARPDLKLFVESGDGDALSIGGNHLIHGINKNFNCVFILTDNQIYGLTKNQTSPTSRQGLVTNTQPQGSYLRPINPIQFALGVGASFVASTAEWLTGHMIDVLDRAYQHPGFSFVHISQRCPKFNPTAFDAKRSDTITFLENDLKGVKADLKFAPDAKVVQHDPSNLGEAFKYAMSDSEDKYLGIVYTDATKPRYECLVKSVVDNTPQKSRSQLFDSYKI